VCPPNRRDDRQERAEAGLAARARVSVLALLEDDDKTVLDRHGRWYIPDRDPRWLRRNALVVLANIGHGCDVAAEQRVRRVLARYLALDDTVLVAHAVWAARCLGENDLLAAVVGHLDAQVQAELVAALPAGTGVARTGCTQ
jgi:epoxyqueuosine reductase